MLLPNENAANDAGGLDADDESAGEDADAGIRDEEEKALNEGGGETRPYICCAMNGDGGKQGKAALICASVVDTIDRVRECRRESLLECDFASDDEGGCPEFKAVRVGVDAGISGPTEERLGDTGVGGVYDVTMTSFWPAEVDIVIVASGETDVSIASRADSFAAVFE